MGTERGRGQSRRGDREGEGTEGWGQSRRGAEQKREQSRPADRAVAWTEQARGQSRRGDSTVVGTGQARGQSWRGDLLGYK